MTGDRLERLEPGMPIPYGGDRVTYVDEELAAAFTPGDALLVLQRDGTLLRLPEADRAAATAAVDDAVAAFERMGAVDEERLHAFYTAFAARLADDATFAEIAEANAADVADAKARGRSTTRLELTEKMRRDMIDGLRGWAERPSARGHVRRTVEHDGWRLEEVTDRLGVVAFVFEGRPNVFADACGVLRSGNTVVFRIGSDALGTARAIVAHALDPALEAAGMPAGAARLVDAPSRAAGWALFSDPRLALAVARGSGQAVEQLGAVAVQAGNDVSLHGTGGAWMLGTAATDGDRLETAAHRSLDRKVCNTLNTCVLTRDAADRLVPRVLAGLEKAAADRGEAPKLHVVGDAADALPAGWLAETVEVARADGRHREPKAEPIDEAGLATEWEWEDSPEITLVLADDLAGAISLCNAYSPHFVVSLISEDPDEHAQVFAEADAPFIGDGFTRWVDGQYALDTPELGLSNWERGRLFGRGGILSGDAIVTVRARAVQHDPDLHR